MKHLQADLPHLFKPYLPSLPQNYKLTSNQPFATPMRLRVTSEFMFYTYDYTGEIVPKFFKDDLYAFQYLSHPQRRHKFSRSKGNYGMYTLWFNRALIPYIPYFRSLDDTYIDMILNDYTIPLVEYHRIKSQYPEYFL